MDNTATGACTVGDMTMASATVHVGLTEWSVKPDMNSVKHGTVHFVARNTGAEKHELVVVSGTALPAKADGAIDESMLAKGALLGRIVVPAGKTCDLTVELKPGAYTLACNLVEQMGADMGNETHVHYAKGMRTTFSASA